jgi:membrane associated rhomboid family serine protease
VLAGDVDNYAHLGGLITGLVIGGWLLIQATQRSEKAEAAIKW